MALVDGLGTLKIGGDFAEPREGRVRGKPLLNQQLLKLGFAENGLEHAPDRVVMGHPAVP
jgi:hypothetical protein